MQNVSVIQLINTVAETMLYIRGTQGWVVAQRKILLGFGQSYIKGHK